MNSWNILLIFICALLIPKSEGERARDPRNNIYLLKKYPAKTVDEGVKKPTRFCQGFEDPTDTDCYMRTGVKTYVCTEPVSFNPCESDIRIAVWHYDHLKHKCYKTSTPVCAGNIVRTLTLIQCLVYCHNKDPYALGKSSSTIFKLNQKKPYIPKERTSGESKKKLVEVKGKPTLVSKPPKIVKSQQKEVEEVYSRSLNGDAELAEYLIDNMKKGSDQSEAEELIENIKKDSEAEINKEPKVDVMESEEKRKLKKSSQIGGLDNDIVGDSILDKKNLHLQSDSMDDTENDGFYLWDE